MSFFISVLVLGSSFDIRGPEQVGIFHTFNPNASQRKKEPKQRILSFWKLKKILDGSIILFSSRKRILNNSVEDFLWLFTAHKTRPRRNFPLESSRTSSRELIHLENFANNLCLILAKWNGKEFPRFHQTLNGLKMWIVVWRIVVYYGETRLWFFCCWRFCWFWKRKCFTVAKSEL